MQTMFSQVLNLMTPLFLPNEARIHWSLKSFSAVYVKIAALEVTITDKIFIGLQPFSLKLTPCKVFDICRASVHLKVFNFTGERSGEPQEEKDNHFIYDELYFFFKSFILSKSSKIMIIYRTKCAFAAQTRRVRHRLVFFGTLTFAYFI